MPVKLAAKNDGLVTVRRSDVQMLFDTIKQQQLKCDAGFFSQCFTARQQHEPGSNFNMSLAATSNRKIL